MNLVIIDKNIIPSFSSILNLLLYKNVLTKYVFFLFFFFSVIEGKLKKVTGAKAGITLLDEKRRRLCEKETVRKCVSIPFFSFPLFLMILFSL